MQDLCVVNVSQLVVLHVQIKNVTFGCVRSIFNYYVLIIFASSFFSQTNY